jgi:hypothetical protein
VCQSIRKDGAYNRILIKLTRFKILEYIKKLKAIKTQQQNLKAYTNIDVSKQKAWI